MPCPAAPTRLPALPACCITVSPTCGKDPPGRRFSVDCRNRAALWHDREGLHSSHRFRIGAPCGCARHSLRLCPRWPRPLPWGIPCPSTPAWPVLAFGVFGSTSGGRGHVHQSCGAHGVVITTEPLKGAPRNQAQVWANCGMNPPHTLHDMRSPYEMARTDCFGGGRRVTNVFEPIFKCSYIALNKMGEETPDILCRQTRQTQEGKASYRSAKGTVQDGS